MNADKLADALRFYANPEIYKPHPHEPAFDRRDDLWKTAAEALAEHDAQPAQAAQPKTLAIFTANQAQMLLDSFGGSPATYALIDCKAGECAPLDDGSPSPAGLYVYDLNCPEEGVIYLGDEDEDSEPRSEQPEKPPFVLERWGFPVAQSKYRLERMADGYWTPWHIAQQALADTRARMQYEFDKARAQAAQPVGVPDEIVYVLDNVACGDDWFARLMVEGVMFLVPLENADEARHILAAKKRRPQPPAQPSADAEEGCRGYCCPACGRCYTCHRRALECIDAARAAEGGES